MSAHFEFDLYIAGETGRSHEAARNLAQACQVIAPGRFRIRVVDVLDDPDAAERERIIATPTVVRRLPLPTSRVVGDLSDPSGVDTLLNSSPAR